MASAPARVVSLFSTTVITEDWERAAEANAALRAAIEQRRSADAGVRLSNVLGWQSDDAMRSWGGDAAAALLDHVVRRCDALTVDIKQTSAERRFRWTTNMWANVSGKHASNQTHCHPGAYWSAVYYVDDGYNGSTDRALGGELVFIDPRMPMIRMGTPDLRFRRSNGTTDHQETWLRPAAGKLVIFPSWLMHSVRAYEGDGTRISIAMNLTAVPVASAP